MTTANEIELIRATDGNYDGDGSLEGKGRLFTFRGNRYLWTWFDLGMDLYLDGGSYPRKRLAYKCEPPIVFWFERRRRSGLAPDGGHDTGLEQITRPCTADEAVLSTLAASGELDRLLRRRDIDPRLEGERADNTPITKPDF